MTVLCTVRGCGAPLVNLGRALACANGHTFDRARSGYINLLQPQDRRSKRPGDAAAAVAARRRFIAAGYEADITRAILHAMDGPSGAALDVGCGEGTLTARIASELGRDTVGLDLSTTAINLAARASSQVTWIVANADRGLPFPDRAFAVVASITARRPMAELRRVLADDGVLVVAVPAPDDLVELRALVYGGSTPLGAEQRVVEELAPSFAVRRSLSVRTIARLDRVAIEDLLASTYRGARRAERARLEGVETLDVTLARDVMVFAPR